MFGGAADKHHSLGIAKPMTCTFPEFIVVAGFLALAIASLFGTWKVSGFLKDIELRHPHVFERLGHPSPQRTAESDVHTIALLQFLFSNEWKTLGDSALDAPAQALKIGVVISVGTVTALLVSLLFVPNLQSLATLACFRAS